MSSVALLWKRERRIGRGREPAGRIVRDVRARAADRIGARLEILAVRTFENECGVREVSPVARADLRGIRAGEESCFPVVNSAVL